MRTSDYKKQLNQANPVVKSNEEPMEMPVKRPVEFQPVRPVVRPNMQETRYVGSQMPSNNSPFGITDEQVNTRSRLVDCYKDISIALEDSRAARMEGKAPDGQPLKKKKKWLLPAIIGGVVALLAAVAVIVFVWKPWASDEEPTDTEPITTEASVVETTTESTTEARELLVPQVEEAIEAMFANSDKTELVASCNQAALDELYALLTEASTHDEDIEATYNRVQTLELYLKAKEYLDDMSKAETALSEVNIEEVQRIKVATEIYTEFGLKTVTANQAQEILDDYSIYTSLKEELSAVTDYLNYDTENARARVALIKHSPNRTELELMLDSIVKEKAVAEAQKAIDDAADEEARAAAEAARQQAEEELAAARAELERIRAEQASQGNNPPETETPSTEPTTEPSTESTTTATTEASVDEETEQRHPETGVDSGEDANP